MLVAIVLTVVLRALKVTDGVDATSPGDYRADLGDEDVDPEIDPHRPAHA